MAGTTSTLSFRTFSGTLRLDGGNNEGCNEQCGGWISHVSANAWVISSSVDCHIFHARKFLPQCSCSSIVASVPCVSRLYYVYLYRTCVPYLLRLVSPPFVLFRLGIKVQRDSFTSSPSSHPDCHYNFFTAFHHHVYISHENQRNRRTYLHTKSVSRNSRPALERSDFGDPFQIFVTEGSAVLYAEDIACTITHLTHSWNCQESLHSNCLLGLCEYNSNIKIARILMVKSAKPPSCLTSKVVSAMEFFSLMQATPRPKLETMPSHPHATAVAAQGAQSRPCPAGTSPPSLSPLAHVDYISLSNRFAAHIPVPKTLLSLRLPVAATQLGIRMECATCAYLIGAELQRC